MNYTVFYFLQSYFTLPTAILTAFLDFLVATAQMMTERMGNFPGNHGCFAKPTTSMPLRQRRRTAYNGHAGTAGRPAGQNGDGGGWNVVKFLAIACST
ncbi:hypothetical protein IGS59_07945 [Janthinobacterium sp. GW460P]|uniref:hypothetical protein n=1 Tax=unclassified Janthinobacterium TaxID=2610881 RepID=UPI00111C70FC|nr:MULTISPECIES: hypothetical protein [unclassified Janthinobacterium]MCC7702165.1 hypothetical protein [Janthinobacterium sp. GW460P]MCC7707673.1 hypothetical protein [Janthinobacterium sp. GW460W]